MSGIIWEVFRDSGESFWTLEIVWLLGSILRYWEVFCDIGKCLKFWEVFYDSGKCFAILGSVLRFWEVFCDTGKKCFAKCFGTLGSDVVKVMWGVRWGMFRLTTE